MLCAGNNLAAGSVTLESSLLNPHFRETLDTTLVVKPVAWLLVATPESQATPWRETPSRLLGH